MCTDQKINTVLYDDHVFVKDIFSKKRNMQDNVIHNKEGWWLIVYLSFLYSGANFNARDMMGDNQLVSNMSPPKIFITME